MSEETTESLIDGDSFETRVLRALAAINGRLDSMGSRLDSMDSRLTVLDSRLTALEEKVSAMDARLIVLEQKVDALDEKVDARLRETRPIWEGVLARLDIIDSKLDVFALDMMEMRAETHLLKKRVPPAA